MCFFKSGDCVETGFLSTLALLTNSTHPEEWLDKATVTSSIGSSPFWHYVRLLENSREQGGRDVLGGRGLLF